MPTERLVAYFRVGVDRHGRLDLGLAAQHMAVADYLEGNARELVGIYTEFENGRRCDRPELARTLAACRRQNAALIIARLDGLAHDPRALSAIFDGPAECPVVFCDPCHAPTGRAGKYFATRMGAVSDAEAGSIGRLRRPGPAPDTAFGGDANRSEPDLPEQDRVNDRNGSIHRRLADQRAAEILPVISALQASGVTTLQGLADALNARGVSTARGGQWYPTTVRNLLRRNVQGSGLPVAKSARLTRIGGWDADRAASQAAWN